MPSLWSDFARTLRRAVPLLLAAGVIQVASWTILPGYLAALGTLVLLPAVNYVLYRIALFDLRAPYVASYASPLPNVFLRFVFMLSLPFVLTACTVFLLSLISPAESETSTSLATLLSYGAFWMTLSVFGTLLPATVDGVPLTLRVALARQGDVGLALRSSFF